MRRSCSKSQSGGAFVEVALILCPLLVLVFGAMTFSFSVFAYNNVHWIARQGTRWAAVRGSSSGNVAATGDIEAFARTQTAGLNTANLDVQASFSPDNNPGGTVTVVVRYTVSPLIADMFGRPFAVRGRSTATILQ
jgi:Flp pilus assembly protein TadG